VAALGARFLHPLNVNPNSIVKDDPGRVDHARKSNEGKRYENSGSAKRAYIENRV